MRGWPRPPVMPACARGSCRPPRCSSVSDHRCRCFRRSPDMPAGYSSVMPMHWWLPRTLLHRRRGRCSTPRLPRTPALNSLTSIVVMRRLLSSMPRSTPTPRHEAVADARRVGRELRRLGVERRIVAQPRAKTGWDSLTDSELKVVNLIAQGATNRSVATAAAPLPSHGENPRPQRIRQTGHYLPRPIGAADARL